MPEGARTGTINVEHFQSKDVFTVPCPDDGQDAGDPTQDSGTETGLDGGQDAEAGPSGPAPEIEITVSGVTITTSPQTVDVGTRTAATEFLRTFILRNQGDADLTANLSIGAMTNATAQVGRAPGNPIEPPPDPGSVDSNGFVGITPTAPGAFSVTVIVTSDDPDEPTTQVVFTGTAQ